MIQYLNVSISHVLKFFCRPEPSDFLDDSVGSIEIVEQADETPGSVQFVEEAEDNSASVQFVDQAADLDDSGLGAEKPPIAPKPEISAARPYTAVDE